MIAALADLFAQLEAGPLGRAARTEPWLYPGAEIVHITGIALVVGPIIALDLRLLGSGRAIPASALTRYLVPFSVCGLILVALSGSVLFAAEAGAIARNPSFQLKLVLIVFGVANAFLFHAQARHWKLDEGGVPRGAQAQALASIAIWLSVIACGRLIAYV